MNVKERDPFLMKNVKLNTKTRSEVDIFYFIILCLHWLLCKSYIQELHNKSTQKN